MSSFSKSETKIYVISASHPLTDMLVSLPKDVYGHSVRMSVTLRMMAVYMPRQTKPYGSLSHDNFLSAVSDGGLYHDLGKLILSDKKESYPLMTEKLLLEWVDRSFESEDYQNVILDMAKHHCERADGKGYPSGLKGDEIPLTAGICAVANAVDDALIGKKLGYEKTAKAIRDGCGVLFLHEAVNCFEMVKDELFALYRRREKRIAYQFI